MRLTRNMILTISCIIVLLAITACAAQSKKSDGYAWMNAVGLKDQKYATACGPAEKYGPAMDVRAGSKPSPTDLFQDKVLNDVPTDKFWYEGTQGVLSQRMRAEPRAALCPTGSNVVMRRPDPDPDYQFNRDCCPPGLSFAGSSSTAIEGVPASPGHFTTKVLLCGRCDRAFQYSEYPLLFKIDWVIEGHAPKRLE